MSKPPGTVERLASGRYRARRKDGSGRYAAYGTFATEAEAWLALREPPEARSKAGPTLGTYGDDYLKRRQALGIRDIRTDRSRWTVHVEPDEIAGIPMREIRPRHVRAWRDRLVAKGLAPSTVTNTLNLLRVALEAAAEDELVTTNPAREIRLPSATRKAMARTDDGWMIANPDDQLALLRSVPMNYWHHVAFALGVGVRNHEQWALRLADIDLEQRVVTIRAGQHGPTKTGKVRRVPLFGLGLDAARVAVETQRGGCPWAFPTPRDNKRRGTDHPRQFKRWLKTAGIDKHFRWYDMRHTCATSLLAGWWGRKWALEEVSQMLGHSSVEVTQRYAHFLSETLMTAGHATGFHADLSELLPDVAIRQEKRGASFQNRTGDLRFTNPRGFQGFSGLAVAEFHARSTARDDSAAAAILEATALAYEMADPAVATRVHELLAEAGIALGLLDPLPLTPEGCRA